MVKVKRAVILLIKHTETQQMDSLPLKVLNGWTNEVGPWKLAERLFRWEIQVQVNSHLSHLNTESHKVLKYSTFTIFWKLWNIATVQNTNPDVPWSVRVIKGINQSVKKLFTSYFKECLCVETCNSCNNCSSTSLWGNCENKGRAIKTCKQFLEFQIFQKRIRAMTNIKKYSEWIGNTLDPFSAVQKQRHHGP